MKKKYLLAQLCICVLLSFGSFANEAAEVIFALRLADDTSSVSALLSAGLVGALLAGPLAPRILHRMGPLKLISLAFVVQSLLITGASLANQFVAYLVVAIALGCTGSIFWSAILVAVPGFARDAREIDCLNRVIQTVRNLGYVGGPALGGVLHAMAGGSQGMLLLALAVFLAGPMTAALFKKIMQQRNHYATTSDSDNSRKGLDFIGFLRTHGVIRAITPLVVTVILTSTLNVLLIVQVRNNLNLSAETYGIIVSMLSVGLVLGPLTLSNLFNRLGDAAGASVAASVIGLGIFWLASTQITWSLMTATFMIGVANGIQNTLMSSFMMKRIPKERRIFQMPAYLLILQASVFIGFVGAGFIKIQNISVALMSTGMITIIVGMCGFLANTANKPSSYLEGAE